jgi:hypothetical protein
MVMTFLADGPTKDFWDGAGVGLALLGAGLGLAAIVWAFGKLNGR